MVLGSEDGHLDVEAGGFEQQNLTFDGPIKVVQRGVFEGQQLAVVHCHIWIKAILGRSVRDIKNLADQLN